MITKLESMFNGLLQISYKLALQCILLLTKSNVFTTFQLITNKFRYVIQQNDNASGNIMDY